MKDYFRPFVEDEDGSEDDEPIFQHYLLTSIEQVLPVSGDEWTAVTSSHNRKWITQKRKEDGLRRKFAKMHTKSVPTGNPHLPLYAKRDKCIWQTVVSLLNQFRSHLVIPFFVFSKTICSLGLSWSLFR